MYMKILLIFFGLSLASYAHKVTYVNDQFDPPLTNSWNHFHWTNSYSGKIYHDEGDGTPAPWIDKYVNDSFGAETLWVNSDEYADDTTFNNCVFYGSNISNLMADVDISHCSGDLSIHARSIDARYSVFENSDLIANFIDVSHASLIGSTLTGNLTFKDTYVRNADLNLSAAEGSVRGTPNFLPNNMKIKNGNLIGVNVQNDGADFSYTDLTDVEFNTNSKYVGANFTGCIISNLVGNFSGANFGGTEINDVGSAVISNASFIAANIGGAHYTNLLNRGAILHLTSVRGSEIDSNTNFFDYAGVATNIHQEILDYLSELDAVSNQIESVSDSSEDLEDSVDLLTDSVELAENNLNSLSDQVISLSNKVISTIHELEPNIEVIGASNGYIALNVGLSSSGDLNNWQTILSKEHVLPATNGVEYFRINTGSQKGQ